MEDNKDLRKLVIDDTSYSTQHTVKFKQRKPYTPPDPNKVLAFIPGIILKIHVKVGQKVKWGESLLILEAMKMKNDLATPRDGVVKAIHVKEGQMVTKHQLLVEFE
jgi:biotin carboxyl carrier protein